MSKKEVLVFVMQLIINKFLVKEDINQTEIFRRLQAQSTPEGEH